MNIGVLASGRGSNLRQLVTEELPVVAVATNRPGCGAAQFAREKGLALGVFPQSIYQSRDDRDRAMLEWLQGHGVQMVVLAGYDRVLSGFFVAAYPDRVLNVHPSLLPDFAGTMDAVAQALAARVPETGCTVHICDTEVDAGPILLQARVPVLPGDTVETLHARIQVEEHRILPEAVRMVAAGMIPSRP